MEKTFNIDLDLKMCSFPKSFWHTNNTIFDVNIHYFDEFIGMVSFSKKFPNGQWWEQSNKFWDKWNPVQFLNELDKSRMIFVVKKKKELVDKLMEKSMSVFLSNKHFHDKF